ncbi:MAG: sulfite oxidase heme-binding subunit YedZ [Burkholderiales bacterium]|nr:sulfoxide reductase heme-binding subunit YedZ [Burkholderiales bacterium]MDQ3195227.1 sulfoxide reductase heme-binding subunit YedZ [Pseudomonadota bacterium]
MLPAHLKPKNVVLLKAVVFAACLLPLARLVWFGLTDNLSANPIEFITRSTGTWTLSFLLITLSITPLRRWLSINWLLRLRRMLGLYAFFYACLHFATYILLDQFFDWDSIVKDIMKRPYITVGFPSFVLLIPLAVTSTNAMIRRLGAKRWQQLHRLVYIIAVAGVIHYWWLVKKDVAEPLYYAVVLTLLLGIRLAWSLQGSRPIIKDARVTA